MGDDSSNFKHSPKRSPARSLQFPRHKGISPENRAYLDDAHGLHDTSSPSPLGSGGAARMSKGPGDVPTKPIVLDSQSQSDDQQQSQQHDSPPSSSQPTVEIDFGEQLSVQGGDDAAQLRPASSSPPAASSGAQSGDEPSDIISAAKGEGNRKRMRESQHEAVQPQGGVGDSMPPQSQSQPQPHGSSSKLQRGDSDGVKSHIDEANIERGSCHSFVAKKPGSYRCDCPQYVRQGAGARCVECGHAPTHHEPKNDEEPSKVESRMMCSFVLPGKKGCVCPKDFKDLPSDGRCEYCEHQVQYHS